MKIERTLNAYGDIIVKVVTDEEIDDMEFAVVVGHHGDQYLIVKTKDGKVYQYGCFANLKDYDYLQKYLITQPQMFKKEDEMSGLSNKLYRLHDDGFFERDNSFFGGLSHKLKKCYSESSAQFDFDYYLKGLDDAHESGIRYFIEERKKDIIKQFLELNGIDTEENLKKFENAHWNSRIDGIDGFAGKKDITTSGSVYFESFGDVVVGKEEDLEIVEDDYEDEWGYSGYYLHFNPDKKLNANKLLYSKFFNVEIPKGFSDKNDYYEYRDDEFEHTWDDWMDEDTVELTDTVKVIFDKTYIDEFNDEPLYLIINHEEGRRPAAAYMTLENVLKLRKEEV